MPKFFYSETRMRCTQNILIGTHTLNMIYKHHSDWVTSLRKWSMLVIDA